MKHGYTRSSIVFKGKSKEDKEIIREDVRHEVQIEAIKDYVGFDDLVLHSESDLSRDTPLDKRPILKEVIQSLKPGDTFIIWKLDRLGSGAGLIEGLCRNVEAKGASIVSVMEPNMFDNTPSARFTKGVLALVSQFVLESIRDNTEKSLKVKKSKGMRVGTIPYGYELAGEDKSLQICHEEQAVMDRMQALKDRYLTLEEIAENLNSAGIQKRSGSPWCRTGVFRILHNREKHREPFLEAFRDLNLD